MGVIQAVNEVLLFEGTYHMNALVETPGAHSTVLLPTHSLTCVEGCDLEVWPTRLEHAVHA